MEEVFLHNQDVNQVQDVNLNERLNKIEEKLDLIINNLLPKCDKMSNHIDFVENVYDRVKAPLITVCDYVDNAKNKVHTVMSGGYQENAYSIE